MDYSLLIAGFAGTHDTACWPRQRLLHERLRAAIAARALEQGIVAHALSVHATGARANGWNRFLLGYGTKY